MKIVILTGSYNLHGTSNTLVDEFIKGAEENNNEIIRFDTAHLNIRPCIGCNHCGMDGDCVFKDDMAKILDAVEAADMLVLATPVYYFAMTAPLKATIDRFYSRTGRISYKRLRTAFIMTCWNTDDSTVEPLIVHYKKLVSYMNYKDEGMIIGKGCGTVGMMPSGIMISADVFSFLDIPTTMFGRNLHMVSTSWGFILMGIHVGLHIAGFMNKLNRKMKNSTFEYVYYFILVLLVGLGIYSFIYLRLWEEMFLLVHFKFFDYEQSTLMFYLKYIVLLIAIILIIYWIFNFINKVKNKKRGRK